MDGIVTHPSTAAMAKNFTAPGSLSFPGGAGDLTPPSSEKDGNSQANGAYGYQNGQQQPQQQQQQQNGGNAQNGNGVTPATPAATPGAGQGVSGIVPTLQ